MCCVSKSPGSFRLDISADLAVEISAMAATSTTDDAMEQPFNTDNFLLNSLGKRKHRNGLATERLISVSIPRVCLF